VRYRSDPGLQVPSVCFEGITTRRHAACMDQSLLPLLVMD